MMDNVKNNGMKTCTIEIKNKRTAARHTSLSFHFHCHFFFEISPDGPGVGERRRLPPDVPSVYSVVKRGHMTTTLVTMSVVAQMMRSLLKHCQLSFFLRVPVLGMAALVLVQVVVVVDVLFPEWVVWELDLVVSRSVVQSHIAVLARSYGLTHYFLCTILMLDHFAPVLPPVK